MSIAKLMRIRQPNSLLLSSIHYSVRRKQYLSEISAGYKFCDDIELVFILTYIDELIVSRQACLDNIWVSGISVY